MYTYAPILRIPWRTCPMKRRTDAKGREHSRTGAEHLTGTKDREHSRTRGSVSDRHQGQSTVESRAERLTGTRDRDTWEPGAEGLTGLFRRAM